MLNLFICSYFLKELQFHLVVVMSERISSNLFQIAWVSKKPVYGKWTRSSPEYVYGNYIRVTLTESMLVKLCTFNKVKKIDIF